MFGNHHTERSTLHVDEAKQGVVIAHIPHISCAGCLLGALAAEIRTSGIDNPNNRGVVYCSEEKYRQAVVRAAGLGVNVDEVNGIACHLIAANPACLRS
jgi:aspartate carbamoyltransferase regulatory subunit